MTAYLLLNHLANFLAPALLVALFMVLLTRVFDRVKGQKKRLKVTLPRQIGIIFGCNLLVLAAGLLLFGNDAKMLSYFAMALASALSHFYLSRG